MSILQFYDSGPWISFESGYRSVGAVSGATERAALQWAEVEI